MQPDIDRETRHDHRGVEDVKRRAEISSPRFESQISYLKMNLGRVMGILREAFGGKGRERHRKPKAQMLRHSSSMKSELKTSEMVERMVRM